jgi:protein-disulfide isomerase
MAAEEAEHNHAHSTQAEAEKHLPEVTATKEELLNYREGDVVFGDKDAPVTIVEYASLSCIHCANFHKDEFPTLKEKYLDTGKAKLIFRNFPLNGPALKGGQLVYCAPEEKQGMFIKTLFLSVSKWAYTNDFLEKLENIARVGGMSKDAFKQCMDDKKGEERLFMSRLEGAKILGVDSTPSFYVGGKKFTGAEKEKMFKQIEAELKK